MKSIFWKSAVLIAATVLLASCGGGGGSAATTPGAGNHTIGGNVSGLIGSILIQCPGTTGFSTYMNGPFTLSPSVPDGTFYDVTVADQPGNQTCLVTNGTGTVAGNDVTNVSIVCETNSYSVGGEVSGLTGSGLVLRNNGEDLAISSNGTFTFATKVNVGTNYAVSVKNQPTGPAQVCSVNNGSHAMPAADVTSVSVICSASTYSISGTASGVTGTVVLRNNDGDDLTVTGNGGFSFATPLADNAGYSVSVKSSGPTQACVITNGTGTVAGLGISNVAVACSATKHRFVYVTHLGSVTCSVSLPCEVAAYSIDATEGSLIKVGTYPTGTNPYGITLDPTGKFAYVTNTSAHSVKAYTVNASTGALTSVASYPTGSNPSWLQVDPTGKFLYVVTANDALSGYSINGASGALTELPGSPYATGTTPLSIAIDPTGKYVYVPNGDSADISAYSIDPGTGVLTPASGSPFPVADAAQPRDVVVNPAGTILYVIGTQLQKIYAYSINGSGALSPIASSPFSGTGPNANSMVMNPSGTFLYVGNYNDPETGTITGFAINGNGSLSSSAGSPYPVTSEPWRSVIDPLGRFMFTVSSWDSKLSSYRIDANTGFLTPVSGTPYTSAFKDYGIAVTP